MSQFLLGRGSEAPWLLFYVFAVCVREKCEILGLAPNASHDALAKSRVGVTSYFLLLA